MAAGENLGARFSIDITDLKAGLAQANRLIRDSESEFRAAAAGMDDWSNSSEGLQKRVDTLTDQIDIQKEKVAALVQEKQNIIDKMTAEGKSNEEIEKAVDGVNKSIEREGKQLDRMQGSLKKSQTALDNMSDSTDDASDSVEDLGDEADKAKTPLEQLQSTIEDQEKALEGLKTEYANVALEYGTTSEEAKALAGEIDKLSRDLKSNKDKLDDVAGAADDAGNKAEKSSDGWTVLKDVIADLASQAVQAAADAFKDLLFSGEAALDMLQAKTGASDKEMAKFGDTAYKVFNNAFGESIEDVTGAMGTVVTMMGEMDDVSLQNITENAMTLDDVFGWDIQESLRAVNSLTKQFGITSDEAFNLMVQGAQNGLDQNGDLLDTVNEYSVQFKNAGFSSEEMFNMLKNGAEEGTWSIDKLGDAVKEYNVRISDGTVADALMENRKALGLTKKEVKALSSAYGKGGEEGKAAMKQTLDAVLAVEDETERYQLGVSLFGTMWEDLGEDAVKALFDTEGGINATNDAMSKVKTDAYDNLGASLTTLGRTLKNDILTPIVDSVAPIVKDFVNWCIENIDTLKPIIIGVASAIGVLSAALAISGIISGVSKAFAILNATMLANPITLIVAAIAGLVAAFVTLWNNNEEFRQFWIDLWDNIKSACSAAIDWIVGVFDSMIAFVKDNWQGLLLLLVNPFAGAFKLLYDNCEAFRTFFDELWANIKTIASDTWEAIVGFFTESVPAFFSSLGEWFSELPGKIGTWLDEAIAKVIAWGTDLVSTGTQKASEFLTGVINWVKELPGKIWTWLSNAAGKVVTWGGNLASNGLTAAKNLLDSVINKVKELPGKLWDWLSDAAGKVVSWGSDLAAKGLEAATLLFNSIVDKVKGIPGEMLSVGSDIVSGLWDGISSGADWLKNKISGWASDITGWAKGFLGIASPSKVFRDEVGKYMAQGVGVGFTDEMRNVKKDIGKALDSTVQNTRSNVSGASGRLASGAKGGIVINQTNNYSQAHTRYELYKNQQATAAAVRLALGGA